MLYIHIYSLKVAKTVMQFYIRNTNTHIEFSRSHLDTSVGRTSPDEGSVRPRDFYQTTHDIYKTKTSTPPGVFDATFSAGKLQQTYFLDLTVAGVVLSTLQ
jgi:hypothetical protein